MPKTHEFNSLMEKLSPAFRETIPIDGYVYFLQDASFHPELIKIGYARKWKNRLKQHRGYLPNPKIIAICPGDKKLESSLHDWVQQHNGSPFAEWFYLKPSEIPGLFHDLFGEYEPDQYPLLIL